MTIELHNVARLRVWTESTFASDGTGTLANYTDVPAVEGSVSVTLGQETLNPEHLQQHTDGYPEQSLGRKSCSISMSLILAPTGSAAGDATAAQQSALGELLAAVMGGENLGTGDVVQASPAPTTTAFAGAAASSRNLDDGAAVGILRGASSALQLREIQARSSETLTLKLALSNAAQTSDVIYGCATYYLAQDPTASLQFIVEGSEQDDRWLLMGCQLESMAIDVPINQLPRITLTFKGATWLHGASTAGVLTGSALGTASYTLVSPVHVDGDFRVATVGTDTLTAGTSIPISALTLTPALGYLEIPSPQGTEGVYRFRRGRNAPAVRGSFRTFYEDTTWLTARDNKTAKAVWFQLGDVQGKAVLLSLPRVQIVDVQRVDAGGVAGQEVTFVARLDSDVTATNDLAVSPFRIHLG